MPLYRVSFYGKNYATGCSFLIRIMRQGITIDKKVMRQGAFWSSLETMDFVKIFMRQGYFWAIFLCDRAQGIERFAKPPSLP